LRGILSEIGLWAWYLESKILNGFKGEDHEYIAKNTFERTDSQCKRAALIIAVAGIGSRLFGFLRDRILASQFGAGDTLDAYYAAFRIPDLLYSFLVLGALSAAFIPVFTELYVQKKEHEPGSLPGMCCIH